MSASKPTITSRATRSARLPAFLLLGLLSVAPCRSSDDSPLKVPPRDELELDLDKRAGLPEETLHFTVESYGSSASRQSQLLESVFLDFLEITGLSQFQPPYKIRVLIFADAKEYHLKLGKNRGAVTNGIRTISTFEQKQLGQLLVTAGSDLLFETFMDWNAPKNETWIKRGISQQVMVRRSGADPEKVRENWRARIKETGPLPLPALVAGPNGNQNFLTTSASLVAFLLDWGGRLNFAFFLKDLKEGQSINDALAYAYPGKLRSLHELYEVWLQQDIGTLKRPAQNQR